MTVFTKKTWTVITKSLDQPIATNETKPPKMLSYNAKKGEVTCFNSSKIIVNIFLGFHIY